MIHLFSNNGLKLLESVCFTRTLYTFDFDGTLSKIVKNPDEAKIQRSTLKLLRRLSEFAPVAVISGRGLADLRKKFDSVPGFLVGNHGLEGLGSNGQKLEAFRELCEKWKNKLAHKCKDIDGVEIEDKTYSLSIHYRKSRSKKSVKNKILRLLKALTPEARIVLGKCVVNVIPVGAPHKGMALLELMKKSDVKIAFYIGDDDTDEDVFSLSDPRLFTVRVGKKSVSQAKFYVGRQSDVNILLKKLLIFLDLEEKESRVSCHGR